MTVLVATLSGLLGLVVGSFANVPIHRWPRGGTVTQPARSACPSCDAPIAVRDNVPVVSWMLLRGRCRHCDAPIAARYPAVEAVTALLFVAVAAVHGPVWHLPALLLATWGLVVATAIDLEHRRIPNVLTYRLAPALLVLFTLAAALEGEWLDWRRAVISGIAWPTVLLTIAEGYRLLRGRMGMGMGDVKLAASIGLVTGWLGGWEIIIAAYGTAISGFVIAIGLVLAGRAGLASKIPYGPYLAIGALLAILVGDPLAGPIERLLLG